MYLELKVHVKVNRLLILKVADTVGLSMISSNIYSELNNSLHELWAPNIQSPLVKRVTDEKLHISRIVSQRIVRLFGTGDSV